MRILLHMMLVATVVALLIACEQEPGEITGCTTRVGGGPASVKIQVVSAKGELVWEGSSDYLSGSWYTGEIIRPGIYTIHYFSATGEEYEGKEQQVTVTAGGTANKNQTF